MKAQTQRWTGEETAGRVNNDREDKHTDMEEPLGDRGTKKYTQ